VTDEVKVLAFALKGFRAEADGRGQRVGAPPHDGVTPITSSCLVTLVTRRRVVKTSGLRI
jgi:hypothetical protein